MSEGDSNRELYGELQLPFRHAYLRGEIFPPFVTEEVLAAVAALELRESDVVITTFPKNGTTWAQKLVQSLHKVHGTGHLQDPNTILIKQLPWLEYFIMNPDLDMDSMASPRYFKTHTPYDMMVHDPAVPCRYIYVARNPKDVCVSLYNHCKGIKKFGYSGEFEEFCQLFLEGKVESGDWWKHVKDHYTNSKNMDMLFLQYEDMHMDGITAVKKINDFCKLPQLSDEKAQKALELSAFKTIKNDPKANYTWMQKDRREGHAPFMRKGVVGDWENWFNQEMAQKFDQKTREIFDGTDLTFVDRIDV